MGRGRPSRSRFPSQETTSRAETRVDGRGDHAPPLELGLALPPFAALAATADLAGSGVALAATPSIADDDEPTPELTEGPYFSPSSPLRNSIVPTGARGTRLTVSGRVLRTTGRPVARALVDFWQADAQGGYDDEGYAFRGHQLTDARGRYTLLTVVPGH